MEASKPRLSSLSSLRLPVTPFYTDDGARVCHWEFPKYISPCVLLSGEEWPEFHSFFHLFLRFHKRREGKIVFRALSLTTQRTPVLRIRAFSSASLARSANLRFSQMYRGKTEIVENPPCSKEEVVQVKFSSRWVFQISLSVWRYEWLLYLGSSHCNFGIFLTTP